MRKQSEKKDVIRSVRMTEEEDQNIVCLAKQRKQSVSAYMVEQSMHPGHGMRPELLVRIQNLLNTAVQSEGKLDPEALNEMRKEANDIWSLLK